MSITTSEKFVSLQEEGLYTGKNTVWVRFALCNLQCDGFKQTAAEVVSDLESLLSMTKGKFVTDLNGMYTSNRHLCFTGEEPLLKQNQQNIIDILFELESRSNLPDHITIETTGTVKLTKSFISKLHYYQQNFNIEFHASISPKLFQVSDKQNKKPIVHTVLTQYHSEFSLTSLKFVVNKDETWGKLYDILAGLAFYSSNVYIIIPVGATKEQQEEIKDRALMQGFNISSRVHAYIYENKIVT